MNNVIDASKQSLGRLASQIAVTLQGKHGPDYNPRLPGAVKVVVKNIAKMRVTGDKAKNKIYYRHTGYMGHLRKLSYEQKFAKSPSQVLREAVYNMLPKNRLRRVRLNRLHLYDHEN